LIASHSIHVGVRRRTKGGLFDVFNGCHLLNLFELKILLKFGLNLLRGFYNLRCLDRWDAFRRVIWHWLVTRRTNCLRFSFTQDLIRIVLLLFADWILNWSFIVFFKPWWALYGILSKRARDGSWRATKIVNHLVDFVIGIEMSLATFDFFYVYVLL
jgi:hypothetical protein